MLILLLLALLMRFTFGSQGIELTIQFGDVSVHESRTACAQILCRQPKTAQRLDVFVLGDNGLPQLLARVSKDHRRFYRFSERFQVMGELNSTSSDASVWLYPLDQRDCKAAYSCRAIWVGDGGRVMTSSIKLEHGASLNQKSRLDPREMAEQYQKLVDKFSKYAKRLQDIANPRQSNGRASSPADPVMVGKNFMNLMRKVEGRKKMLENKVPLAERNGHRRVVNPNEMSSMYREMVRKSEKQKQRLASPMRSGAKKTPMEPSVVESLYTKMLRDREEKKRKFASKISV